ncbi:hypothetical protein C8R45DRAFT_510503 [Mycena sanguinolenta]|nr:hypothetical protein C8R45DRAFT_510503 [Mycena sanguinolenta]
MNLVQVMPKCRVDYETGDEWDEGDKSYSSYNIAYQLQDMRLDAERAESHPMEVRVGMGINLQPASSEKPLPQISFVNRKQVLIWVSDPASKSKIRGIVVLMSSYLDNIRAEEKVSIYENEQVELSPLPCNAPITKKEERKQGIISLAIAQVEHQCARLAKLRTLITKLGRTSVSSSPTTIPTHEYLARGWDVNNNEWRNILWPALDKNFRAADLERASPVWKIQVEREFREDETKHTLD